MAEQTKVDVLTVMVRDSTDAEKFRIANQHTFPGPYRLVCRRESDSVRAAVTELMEQASDTANWADQVAKRADVPSGIRKAAAGIAERLHAAVRRGANE